jgi:hypothetical protein
MAIKPGVGSIDIKPGCICLITKKAVILSEKRPQTPLGLGVASRKPALSEVEGDLRLDFLTNATNFADTTLGRIDIY